MTSRVLISHGEINGVDSKSHRVTAVISTNAVARDGAMISTQGWDFSEYMGNPTVLWQHDTARLPVARCVELSVQGDNLVAVSEFDMQNPEAAALFGAIERGYVRATSVRWTPQATSVKRINGKEVLSFDKQSLIEYSFVNVPVDPSALVIRSEGGDALKIEDFVDSTVEATADDDSVLTQESPADTSRAGLIQALALYTAARVGITD